MPSQEGRWLHFSPGDPRVTLVAEGTVADVPLYGRVPAEWVDEMNVVLKARNITLVFKDVDAEGSDSEDPDSDD